MRAHAPMRARPGAAASSSLSSAGGIIARDAAAAGRARPAAPVRQRGDAGAASSAGANALDSKGSVTRQRPRARDSGTDSPFPLSASAPFSRSPVCPTMEMNGPTRLILFSFAGLLVAGTATSSQAEPSNSRYRPGLSPPRRSSVSKVAK
jgi:hypothetical protein